ncbi:OmpA family protein [Cognatazoarcus halotolerans]|uniref:OmpA family protein n=1 Tax=Cognatazoarcus halotolerans TaxID=2686016 RepID=UPI00135A1B4D|nr:OmpA family protein [Cognatazoarcus halotolerans]MBX3680530.1 OmpA family protein [Rhodocyclaceae bacterium]MCB1901563.1 OmpA family protein [Rhodocyclaceae bacterium]MCP5310977.1 OmpA family protein [Zoogloeaceae bacterium]
MSFRNCIALMLIPMVAACAITSTKPADQAAANAPNARDQVPARESTTPVAYIDATRSARLAEVGVKTIAASDGSQSLRLPGSMMFGSGSTEVRHGAYPALDRIAEILIAEPAARATIEGHTDSIGRELYNQELSLRRADAVRQYLLDRGIAAPRIDAEGRGESRPLEDNGTPEGREANRRIEIILK